VPLILKEVVDSLDARTAVLFCPSRSSLLTGSSDSRRRCSRSPDVVFVRVTQRAIRRVALTVFRHMHSLSLRFHLERHTGGVSRDIERGTRGISTLLTYMLFSIVPVISSSAWWRPSFSQIRLALRGGQLLPRWWSTSLSACPSPSGAWKSAATQTSWIRRPTRAQSTSLLNYETVKYFNNEELRGAPLRREPAEIRVRRSEERSLARASSTSDRAASSPSR